VQRFQIRPKPWEAVMDLRLLTVAGVMGCMAIALGVVLGQGSGARPDRKRLDKLFADGNFKDAYEGYRALALDAKSDPQRVGSDLGQARECLLKLARAGEIDVFREAVVALHQGNSRLLQAAAESLLDLNDHMGAIVAGRFERGRHAGRLVGSYERDRARAL